MINLIASGIAGCGEKEYFEKFVKFCKKQGKGVNLISVTDIVLEVSRKCGMDINKYNLLNLPITSRTALYSAAFERIISQLEKDSINLINFHFTYWWKNGAEEVVSALVLKKFLEKLNPIFFLNIQDKLGLIIQRLRKPFDHVGRVMAFEDIMRWQDFEYYVAKIFAEFFDKKIYLIEREYPAQTLYRLIFEPTLKAYLSFPMLFLKSKKERGKIKKFIEEVDKEIIAFPPIEELYAVEMDERVKRLYAELIVRRDFRLIDQSDMVIAYFPKVVHSAGVILEMQYAYSCGKPVYLIWPHKNYSAFTLHYIRKMLKSTKEALDEIREMVKKFKAARFGGYK